jgi:hypothetical protein
VDGGVTIAAIVRMSEEDVDGGQRYEDLVLALLPVYGGRVERRLRSNDGLTEVQILWFPSFEAMEAVIEHPDRQAARDRLGADVPATEVIEVSEV